ncbi:hypothetical protein Pan5_28 [Pseudanabaena phage Pan5]|nr:hypothetical protein Pan5_28 [Pseudanabaena phage Pan5]
MIYLHIIHIDVDFNDHVRLSSKLELAQHTITIPLHGKQPSEVATAYLNAKGFNIIGYAAGYEEMIISDTIKSIK